jgi:hypothetical protein
MKTKHFIAWFIFVIILGILGSMAVCNAVELPRFDVSPFVGVHLNIAPEHPDMKIVDGIAGTSILRWYNWTLGTGATSHSWGLAVGKQPLIWLPVYSYLFIGHVWSTNDKPYVFGGGFFVEW